MANSIKKALAVLSIIIAIVATMRKELQQDHYHNTIRVSTKKERKEWERIKVTRRRKKKRKKNQ